MLRIIRPPPPPLETANANQIQSYLTLHGNESDITLALSCDITNAVGSPAEQSIRVQSLPTQIFPGNESDWTQVDDIGQCDRISHHLTAQ